MKSKQADVKAQNLHKRSFLSVGKKRAHRATHSRSSFKFFRRDYISLARCLADGCYCIIGRIIGAEVSCVRCVYVLHSVMHSAVVFWSFVSFRRLRHTNATATHFSECSRLTKVFWHRMNAIVSSMKKLKRENKFIELAMLIWKAREITMRNRI